ADIRHRGCHLYFLRLQRVTGRLPGLIAALQRERCVAAFAKVLRHTGARSFIRSRTIRDDLPADRQLMVALLDLAGVDPDRARDRPVHLWPDVLCHDVQDARLTGLDSSLGLGW